MRLLEVNELYRYSLLTYVALIPAANNASYREDSTPQEQQEATALRNFGPAYVGQTRMAPNELLGSPSSGRFTRADRATAHSGR
jgi:hypothetical protein